MTAAATVGPVPCVIHTPSGMTARPHIKQHAGNSLLATQEGPCSVKAAERRHPATQCHHLNTRVHSRAPYTAMGLAVRRHTGNGNGAAAQTGAHAQCEAGGAGVSVTF